MRKEDKKSTLRRNKTTTWIGVIFLVLAGTVIWIASTSRNSTSEVADFQEVNQTPSSDFVPDELVETNERNSGEVKNTEKSNLDQIDSSENEQQGQIAKENQPQSIDRSSPIGYIEGQELPTEPKIIKGIVLANKQYPLPKDYALGESEEAREAFNELAAAALTAGIHLQAFSTYRSYDYQVTLYNRYVNRDGVEAADRYSARPGYSEHQTGLAFDIGEVNHEKHWASSTFGSTEAAKWLRSHAHKYGFILRYPEGKEDITGYMHESWHYRYVGKQVAGEIFKKNITLEEYLGIG